MEKAPPLPTGLVQLFVFVVVGQAALQRLLGTLDQDGYQTHHAFT
jgi:hypothetical protein